MQLRDRLHDLLLSCRLNSLITDSNFYPNVTTLRSGLCYRKSVCLSSVVCLSVCLSVTLVHPTQGLKLSAILLHRCVRWPSSDHHAKFYLQWKTNRKSYMAYKMSATAVTLSNLEGHSPVVGLFKCNLWNICAAFYMISTDSVLAVVRGAFCMNRETRQDNSLF